MQVAVLGAGLQGACIALDLGSRGVSVDLYDRAERPVSRASAHNEGKIHLGFVFAHDSSRRTAEAMVRGALTFAPLLRSWLGPAADRLVPSRPFNYLVHAESLLTPDEVDLHLQDCRRLALEIGEGAPPDYFGADYRLPSRRLTEAEWDGRYNPALTRAVFETPEIAIDPEKLAELVRRRLLDHPLIRCVMRTEVRGVVPRASSVTVEAETAGQPVRIDYDHAVNSLWEGRLTVDRSAGLVQDRLWLHRVKYYLRLRGAGVASALPPTTMVLGPFGDVVGYPEDDLSLSWYPVGMRATSSEVAPPDWPTEPDAATCRELRSAIPAHLARIIPAVAALPERLFHEARVRGGPIFAWGQGDIDDPASGLHERYQIGPQSFGRYHTVDTGKLTVAPLFARRTAERILSA